MFVYHTHTHWFLSLSLGIARITSSFFFSHFVHSFRSFALVVFHLKKKKSAYVYLILRSLIVHSSTKPYSVSMITRHLYTKYPSFFHSVEISFFVHSRSICYVLSLINYIIFFFSPETVVIENWTISSIFFFQLILFDFFNLPVFPNAFPNCVRFKKRLSKFIDSILPNVLFKWNHRLQFRTFHHFNVF